MSRMTRIWAALLVTCSASFVAKHYANAGPPSADAEIIPPPEAKQAPHPGGQGSTILVDAHGLLIAERTAGLVIRADRDGQALAQLTMKPNLGQLVHDNKGVVFVADRMADRVVRIDPGDARGQGLAELGSVSVREPWGLALTPDSKLLLVTSVADHELLAFDVESLQLRWRVRLAPEPRPVAVSPDGDVAAVGFLSSGALAIVELSTPEPRVSWRALDPRDHVDIVVEERRMKGYRKPRTTINAIESRSRFRVPVETGRQYARNVMGLGFVGEQLIATHQLATPQLERMPQDELRDTYGGGAHEIRPIVDSISYVNKPGLLDSWVTQETLLLRRPIAFVHDPTSGRLYVAGQGADDVKAIGGDREDRYYVNMGGDPLTCGIDGLALDGDTLWIHCGISRQLAKVSTAPDADHHFELLPELASNPNDELVTQGAQLFNRASWVFSGSGLACANCHPEGRNDGLSWRLGPEILQTPMLAGRVDGTGPYKWDGQDPNLHASFRHTMERLGGRPDKVEQSELDAIAAYLKSLPPPVARSVADPEAAARGRAVFEEQSCDACHEGPKLTDRSQHRFETRLRRVDTPSLIGLGHSSPYYHDGSASDLWSLVTDKGSVHDMADFTGLDDQQRRDLIAYLEGL